MSMKKNIPKSYSELPDIVTVDEASAFLRVGRSLIYEQISQRAIRSIRIGRRILIPKSALKDVVDGESANQPHTEDMGE